MSVKFSNNATTELASSIGTLNTSITVVDASKFPILTAGDYTYVTLDTDTVSPIREIVRVTAISGNVLTVTRGQDGTSPASFAAGTKVELRLTAALLNDAADITSADVTSALGYTPYNATNPAGYTTNVGTVTSVSGTGTVSGLTLTGSVTSSGSLTLGGTLSLTSGDVTTGLGYTPYNATNPSGYISGNQAITVSGDASGSGATSIALTLANSGVSAGTYTKVTVDAKGRVTTGASLASGDLPTYTGSITSGQVTTGLGYTPLSNATSYLPLSGGTLTGQLTTSYSGARHSITDGTNGITIGLWDGSNIRFEGTGRPMYLVSYGGTVSIGRSSGSNLVVDTSTISYGANALLHAGNYNSYAPTLTGTGASGTWGISVTGNAATATNSTQLGGFSKDYFVYGDTGNTGSVNTYIPDGGIGANAITRSCFFRDNESNFTALGIHIQHANNGGYGVQIGSNYAGTTWLVRAKVAGTWGSSATLLTSGNYSSYALPLSGGTVSGSITATGNVTGGRIVLRDDSLEIHATDNDTAGVAVNYNGYASGTSRFRNFTVYDGKGGSKFQVNGSTGAVTAGGNQVLHAGNYSSGYFKTINGSSIIGTGDLTVSGTDSTKLPLSGGTLTGAIYVGTTGSGSATRALRVGPSGGSPASFGSYAGSWRSTIEIWDNAATRMLHLTPPDGTNYNWSSIKSTDAGLRIDVGGSGGTNAIDIGTNGVANFPQGLQQGGNQVLHAGNYTSYSPSLTGSGASGTWGINVTGTAGSISGYNNPTTTATANTIAYRTAEGDIAVRELIMGVAVQDFTPSSMVAVYPTTNQAVKVTAGGARNFLDVPTRTGGNASGTWGISITGNANYASSAGSASTATRSTIEDTRAAQRTPNAYDDYRASYEFTNQIVGSDWHTAFTMQGWHDGYAAWQIIGPASTSAHENFYLRSGINTTWNSARTILHSGNYTSYSAFSGLVTSSGNNGFANATYFVSVRNPIWSFGNASSYGISYYQGSAGRDGIDTITLHPNGSTTATGATFATNSNNAFVNNNVVLNAANYTSYSPSLGGSGASGTWSINVTGSAGSAPANGGTATALNASNYISRTGTSGNANTDFNNTPAGSVRHHGDDSNVTNSPGGTWWFYDHYRHSNSGNYWGTQIAWGWEDNANSLAQRNVTGGTWSGWVRYLNSGNYSSYALPLSGGTIAGNGSIDFGPNSSWGVTLRVGGNGHGGSTRASVVTTNGNLHIDAAANLGVYFGWYNSGTTGVYFGNGAAGQVGRIDGAGNASFSGSITAGNGMTVNAAVINAPQGYVSNSNPWSTSNSAFFPNGITTANATNWMYGHCYLGNAPSNGSGAQIESNGKFFNSTSSGVAMHVRRTGSAGTATNSYTALFEQTMGDHSWGIVAEFRAGGSGGSDRPSILFSNGYNSTTWSVGFGYYDDQFRINQNHGYRNSGWGTERFRIDTGGIAYLNGNVALHAGNYTSYAPTVGSTNNLTNIWYFLSNRDTSSNSPPLQAASTSGGAIMSFHRHGVFAINMGLDSDNVFRIGGWSAGNNRLQMDMSGNLTMAGFIRPTGNVYIDQNYGHGHVGLYDAGRYQGVFFMGDSYKMSADGTSLANMYGIGWSHPNAGGAAGNLTDHGMLIINNGGFRCAISNSIVASGNITAYSDERLKKNWRDMPDNFVERLAQVRVGCYERIDDGTQQVGVSAQSLQPLLPEAIQTAKDEIGTLSVSYGNAAMASAVELAKELVALKHKVTELEARIH